MSPVAAAGRSAPGLRTGYVMSATRSRTAPVRRLGTGPALRSA
ncbi:hypothetical protein [Actinoplanes sp. NPDC026623]